VRYFDPKNNAESFSETSETTNDAISIYLSGFTMFPRLPEPI
jgi:hypothetical protein